MLYKFHRNIIFLGVVVGYVPGFFKLVAVCNGNFSIRIITINLSPTRRETNVKYKQQQRGRKASESTALSKSHRSKNLILLYAHNNNSCHNFTIAFHSHIYSCTVKLHFGVVFLFLFWLRTSICEHCHRSYRIMKLLKRKWSIPLREKFSIHFCKLLRVSQKMLLFIKWNILCEVLGDANESPKTLFGSVRFIHMELLIFIQTGLNNMSRKRLRVFLWSSRSDFRQQQLRFCIFFDGREYHVRIICISSKIME